MLGYPILCLKAMRITMFQLSGFYCKPLNPETLAQCPNKKILARCKLNGKMEFPQVLDLEAASEV